MLGQQSGVCSLCSKNLKSEGLGQQCLPCGYVMHELCVLEFRRSGTGICPNCKESHPELMPVRDLLVAADYQYQRGDYQLAVRNWEDVLSIEPSNNAAALNLAWCFHEGRGVRCDVDKAKSLHKDVHKLSIIQNSLEMFEQTSDLRGLAATAMSCGLGDRRGLCSLAEGARVKVSGLSSAAGVLLNSQVGSIVGFNPSTGRYLVKVDKCETIHAICPRNLKHVRTKEEEIGGAVPTPKPEGLNVCDIVWIHNLVSSSSLNGRRGKIINFNKVTGRFGVLVDGELGCKAIRPQNLTRDIPAEATPHVVLLKFSRPSLELKQIMVNAAELESCRAALRAENLAMELEASGAKVFVRPEHYLPALEAIEINGLTLYPNHVVVDPDLEPVVVNLARKIPGSRSTYPKCKTLLPLGLANSADACHEDLPVERRFIHIRVPSSLRSDSDVAAPRTASTTDADQRTQRLNKPVRCPHGDSAHM